MIDHAVSRIEEKIARHRLLGGYLDADLSLLVGAARKGHAELGVDLLRKSGAVAAHGERLSAPHIGVAEELHGERDHGLAVNRRLAESVKNRIQLLGRLKRMPESVVLERIHKLFGEYKILLALLLYIAVHRLSPAEDRLVDETADLTRLGEIPVGILILQNIAETVLVQRSDHSRVEALVLADIDGHACLGLAVDLLYIFKTDIEGQTLLRERYEIRPRIILAVRVGEAVGIRGNPKLLLLRRSLGRRGLPRGFHGLRLAGVGHLAGARRSPVPGAVCSRTAAVGVSVLLCSDSLDVSRIGDVNIIDDDLVIQ